MNTFHIHIKGRVQGVGFRPLVYKLAKEFSLPGWINNSSDGVHIEVTGNNDIIKEFNRKLRESPPKLSHITSVNIEQVQTTFFEDFQIITSHKSGNADVLMTPDFALCEDCKNELINSQNRRFNYPFITCTNCGPRFSIITGLPYDRPYTTMSGFQMCQSCEEEYNNPENRRHFSQTNSCIDCGVNFFLFDKKKNLLSDTPTEILSIVIDSLKKGQTIAVKGIGGYLLITDATNKSAIKQLRIRKKRPYKPFAVMYASLDKMEEDVELSDEMKHYLQSPESPIVLAPVKQNTTLVCNEEIAPGNPFLGVMLPYTPLFDLILTQFRKPIVATSGNISGSPIIFEDNKALEKLTFFADYILTNDREIVVPQDDSVIRFSQRGKQVILRRSRGFAPSFYPSFKLKRQSVLSMGGELKSSFCMQNLERIYISQYLGNMSSFDTHESYRKTLEHMTRLLDFKPQIVLADKHPVYFTSELAKKISIFYNIPINYIQHHKAHFAAVLAENNLLESEESVLGIIWDGTGWGEDGTIWGSEIFLLENGHINRKGSLSLYKNLLGDKMAKEPRLSALSLVPDKDKALLKNKFSDSEWAFFAKVVDQDNGPKTTSMGRLFDAVSSILGLKDIITFEGEAAMALEFAALKAGKKLKEKNNQYYKIKPDLTISTSEIINHVIKDVQDNIPVEIIAYRFHLTLVRLIKELALLLETKKIAFSGGVFQNTLLIDMITDHLQEFDLYFHKQLSPNDECISLGQLAYYYMVKNRVENIRRKKAIQL